MPALACLTSTHRLDSDTWKMQMTLMSCFPPFMLESSPLLSFRQVFQCGCFGCGQDRGCTRQKWTSWCPCGSPLTDVNPVPAEIPTMDILEEAVTLAPRPVPNLGFACLNATLRAQRPIITTNRDCIKARCCSLGGGGEGGNPPLRRDLFLPPTVTASG